MVDVHRDVKLPGPGPQVDRGAHSAAHRLGFVDVIAAAQWECRVADAAGSQTQQDVVPDAEPTGAKVDPEVP